MSSSTSVFFFQMQIDLVCSNTRVIEFGEKEKKIKNLNIRTLKWNEYIERKGKKE